MFKNMRRLILDQMFVNLGCIVSRDFAHITGITIQPAQVNLYTTPDRGHLGRLSFMEKYAPTLPETKSSFTFIPLPFLSTMLLTLFLERQGVKPAYSSLKYLVLHS